MNWNTKTGYNSLDSNVNNWQNDEDERPRQIPETKDLADLMSVRLLSGWLSGNRICSQTVESRNRQHSLIYMYIIAGSSIYNLTYTALDQNSVTNYRETLVETETLVATDKATVQ